MRKRPGQLKKLKKAPKTGMLSRQSSGSPLKRIEQLSGPANTSVQNVSIKSRVVRKWQPPSAATINYMMDLVDDSVKTTLGAIDANIYEEVQNTLNQLKNRLKANFTRMKVPHAKLKNYHSLQQSVANMNEDIENNIEQTEKVDDELDRISRMMERLEEEKDELEQEMENVSGVEPFNQETTNDLVNEEALINVLQAVINSLNGCDT